MADARQINKTMDRADLARPDVRAVCEELDELVHELKRSGLRASSWYGKFDLSHDRFQAANRGYGYEALPDAADDLNFPWFLYWEIGWLVVNNDYRPGDRLLDLGGSSSLFSYYLASKGLEVTTVDLNRDLVANADAVARRTGLRLANHVGDMRDLRLDGSFDHVASVCVFEHLPLSGRIEVSSRIPDLLRPRGSFSITFDYANPLRSARIDSPDDVHDQFVRPSRVALRQNQRFHDNGKRYLLQPCFHPRAWRRGWKPLFLLRRELRPRDLFRVSRENDYTFGALFTRRPG